MSDLDALLWDLETQHAALRPVITVAVSLDRRPDLSAVADRLDLLSRRIPRFRDRVTRGPLATAPPKWEPDPTFDVGHHLVDAGALGGTTGALQLGEQVASVGFPPDRPPWQMHLGHLDAGAAVLIIKLHHTYTDGVGAVRLAGELFDAERQPPVRAPAPPLPPAPVPPRLRGVWDDLLFEAGRGLGVGRALVPWAAAAVRDAALDPGPRAQEVFDLIRDVETLGRTARSPGSPLLAGRSARSSFAAIDLSLDEMRAAGAGAGGTINDVFLSGILGGLRLYHAKHGEHPASLRIGIPASTRGGEVPEDPEVHNQFVPLVIRAPLQLLDAAERVRLVHGLVLAARRGPVLEGFERATGLLRRLPGALRLAAGLLGSVDLMASNVPGSPAELYLAGARVERMVPFGPRSGAGLNLTLLSHRQTVHIGINSDAVALPDQDVLVDCLRCGFEEVLA
jgi:WS/DGAT/MGAT family acyltransferase